jgi:hypothetical protein
VAAWGDGAIGTLVDGKRASLSTCSSARVSKFETGTSNVECTMLCLAPVTQVVAVVVTVIFASEALIRPIVAGRVAET